MTDKIPDEIMRKARGIVSAIAIQKPNAYEAKAEIVALALMARDQRAAEIAQTEGVSPELNVFGGGPDWYKHGKRIARAILSYDEATMTDAQEFIEHQRRRAHSAG